MELAGMVKFNVTLVPTKPAALPSRTAPVMVRLGNVSEKPMLGADANNTNPVGSKSCNDASVCVPAGGTVTLEITYSTSVLAGMVSLFKIDHVNTFGVPVMVTLLAIGDFTPPLMTTTWRRMYPFRPVGSCNRIFPPPMTFSPEGTVNFTVAWVTDPSVRSARTTSAVCLSAVTAAEEAIDVHSA